MNFTNNNYEVKENKYYTNNKDKDILELNTPLQKHNHKYIIHKKKTTIAKDWLCVSIDNTQWFVYDKAFYIFLKCMYCNKTKKIRVSEDIYNSLNKNNIYNKNIINIL